jgi:hypothetical protein
VRIARNRVVDVVFAGTLAAVVAACGASSSAPGTPTSSASAGDEGEAPAGNADGGAKEERPFAGSTAEATQMISEVVDKKQPDITACVREFRARKKDAPKKVVVSFGIDQEGRLLGVTSKGNVDTELKTCVADALRRAPFPRSHAGVITVTKTYEDLLVQ